MATLKIISSTKDLRTNTHVLYAQIDITDYIKMVGKNFDRFEIQRPRQKHKAYNRMEKDIAKGALLPSITLAVNPKVVDQYLAAYKEAIAIHEKKPKTKSRFSLRRQSRP